MPHVGQRAENIAGNRERRRPVGSNRDGDRSVRDDLFRRDASRIHPAGPDLDSVRITRDCRVPRQGARRHIPTFKHLLAQVSQSIATSNPLVGLEVGGDWFRQEIQCACVRCGSECPSIKTFISKCKQNCTGGSLADSGEGPRPRFRLNAQTTVCPADIR